MAGSLMAANLDYLAGEGTLSRGQLGANVLTSAGGLFKSAGGMLNSWMEYTAAKGRAAMAQGEADALRATAGAYLRDAREQRRLAGEAQLTGRDEAALRLLALGQDAGRMYAGAAAAGLSAGSRTVRAADLASRRNASRDVAAVSHNARESAAAHMSQALSAEHSWIAQHLQANLRDAQARYERRVARAAMRAGMVSQGAKLGGQLLSMGYGYGNGGWQGAFAAGSVYSGAMG